MSAAATPGERIEGKPIASPEDTLTVALSLARAGWPVFPVKLVPVTRPDGSKAVDKRPLIKWLEGASTDAEQVATWWGAEFAGAWIGVMAQRAGIVVVDIDKAKTAADGSTDGRDGKANLKAAAIRLPRTFSYQTRGGGTHHVYRAPDARALTIGRDVPVPGVDIRAGNGLMVYYGPELTEAPQLAEAPDWALLTPASSSNALTAGKSGGTLDSWRARADNGKPSKAAKRAARAVTNDLAHEPMLAAVSELVKLGTERGILTAYDEARATYLTGRPDRARDWDNAAQGSVDRHGLPPVTLAIPKAERKALKQRDKPDARDEAEEARKREYRIKKHVEAHDAPKPGVRILEDGPLAVELADKIRNEWAWAKTHGLLRYDGVRWVVAEPHDLVERVRKELTDIEVDEHELAARRGDNKAIDKARTLLSRNRARAVTELVVGRLAARRTLVNAHPDLLNAPNGVIDLRTGKLRPHDPALMMTKVTGAVYERGASSDDWTRALKALPKDTRAWMQLRFGQAATGYIADDDRVPFLRGGGDNGKSVVLSGARNALGEYAVTVPERLLLGSQNEHPTDLMTLQGARLAVVEELPEGRHLNTQRIKTIAGTQTISARRMRQDYVEFPATHSLMVSTNHLPIVTETDHGTWRRLALVPFPFKFVAEPAKGTNERQADPALRARLSSTADPGVLAWIVEGAVAWYANDRKIPAMPSIVADAFHAWRGDADPVLGYVRDRLVLDKGHAIAATDLYEDFGRYIELRNQQRWGDQLVAARFADHDSLPGVVKSQTRFRADLQPSRPPGLFPAKPLPDRPMCYIGIRFRAAEPALLSEADLDAEALADLERRLK